jgi:protein-tyrosine phosphatase
VRVTQRHLAGQGTRPIHCQCGELGRSGKLQVAASIYVCGSWANDAAGSAAFAVPGGKVTSIMSTNTQFFLAPVHPNLVDRLAGSRL